MDLKAEYEKLISENQRLKEELEISLHGKNEQGSKPANGTNGNILIEIFQTISQYLALYRYEPDNKFRIVNINGMVEQVEFVRREDILGKLVSETTLGKRSKLLELLNHIRITGEAFKLSASVSGNDSEGFYMGFPLSNGNIVISWEPGHHQKYLDDLNRQGAVFEKFAEMLPEMIYEVGLDGKVKYGNKRALDFFGYTKEDLKKGLYIRDLFPDSYQEMMANLSALGFHEQSASNEYLGKKKDGTLTPVTTHSFPTYLNDKIISYRGVISDISRQKEYENQIKREKAFLEHIYDSAPTAIVITNADGIISMINKEFTNIFGFQPEEAVNRNVNDIIVPAEMKEEAEMIDNLAEINRRDVRETIRKGRTEGRYMFRL